MASANQQESQSGNGVDPTLKRPGGLSYLVISATDVRQSAAFYAALLGWTISAADSDHPKFIDSKRLLLGRWDAGKVPDEPAGLLPYFYVEHIDEVVAKVVSQGGTVVDRPRAEADLRVAKVRDPGGNLIGLWEHPVGPDGAESMQVPGT